MGGSCNIFLKGIQRLREDQVPLCCCQGCQMTCGSPRLLQFFRSAFVFLHASYSILRNALCCYPVTLNILRYSPETLPILSTSGATSLVPVSFLDLNVSAYLQLILSCNKPCIITLSFVDLFCIFHYSQCSCCREPTAASGRFLCSGSVTFSSVRWCSLNLIKSSTVW